VWSDSKHRHYPLALLDPSESLGKLGRWPCISLSDVHDVFHVSQQKKCLCVREEQLPMEELSVQGDLTYTEHRIKILDTLTRVT
jgi:hypothetical protein